MFSHTTNDLLPTQSAFRIISQLSDASLLQRHFNLGIQVHMERNHPFNKPSISLKSFRALSYLINARYNPSQDNDQISDLLYPRKNSQCMTTFTEEGPLVSEEMVPPPISRVHVSQIVSFQKLPFSSSCVHPVKELQTQRLPTGLDVRHSRAAFG